MKFILRFIYLGYYMVKLDRQTYCRFIREVKGKKKIPVVVLIFRSIGSVFRYNISLLEYFQFRFFELPHTTRLSYAGTGYMYEYQLLMNPRKYRDHLEDKRKFLDTFRKFIQHQYADMESFKQDKDRASRILSNPSGKIVLKKHDGQCGIGVEVLESSGITVEKVLSRLKENKNDIVEEYIIQHPDLMRLSPSGVNTVRVYTQLNRHSEVEILGCRLRISVNSVVDNLAAGNIAAPIDEKTGIINGPGVYSDITKEDAINHPVTGVPIVGFRVPFWEETLDMVQKAALSYPQCRSVGWDIAITAEGPELVEGNHDWCKLVWQLPVKKGLKSILERHKAEYRSNMN